MKLVPALSACVLFLASWMLFIIPAQAASLYIDPGISTLNRGDSITMSVRLDTDEEKEECVNSVDGVITYSTNIEPVDISVGDSIFSLWVEKPTINRDDRTITFAGGVPNGYCGRVIGDPRLTNVLTKIVFRSPGFTIGGEANDEKVATIEFTDESTAYLNDGKGTKAPLTTYGATIDLNSRPGPTMQNDWKDQVSADNMLPEEFAVELVKGDGNFSNKYYIVFNTTDKQTGVDHYEVMEEPLSLLGAFQWGRADAPWINAQSPYVLEDQSLNITIRVKAVDKAGNEYIATLVPDESIRTKPSTEETLGTLLWFVILALMLVIGALLWMFLKRKKKAQNELGEAEQLESGTEQNDQEEEPDVTDSETDDDE